MTKKIWIYFYTSTNDENLASGCDQRCGSAVCVSDEVPPQSRMVVVSGLVEPTPPIVSNNISPLPPWKTRDVRSLKIKKNTPF